MCARLVLPWNCLFCWTWPAHGEELLVALHSNPAPLKTELPIRIAAEGLALGASPDEIVKAIHAIDPEMPVERTTDRLVVNVDSRRVASEPFLSQIKATNMRYRSGQQIWTRLAVSFALPTTGGGAIGISLEHGAADFIMTGVALHDQLVGDYGQPSTGKLYATDDPIERLRGSLSMQWRFGHTSLLPCPSDCSADSSPIDTNQLDDYQQTAAQGTYALISMLASSNAKHTGIWATSLSLEDAATKALSLREGVRQLTEAEHATHANPAKSN